MYSGLLHNGMPFSIRKMNTYPNNTDAQVSNIVPLLISFLENN